MSELFYLPLGGAGEIGMNQYLYGLDDSWVMVDCGIGFADESMPGIDIMVADPAFIADRRERLAGIVITHGHEDHVGAVPLLWERLRCPVYASPFGAAVLRSKLARDVAGEWPEIHIYEPGVPFRVGPFEIEAIRVTHSVPEAHALALRSEAGTVVHSGDWKIDRTPLIGASFDESPFRRLGDEGVLAYVSDSTNALVEGEAGSERAVRATLTELFRDPALAGGRIAVTCFSTNVARISAVFDAAAAAGRQVAVVGRALRRMIDIAGQVGIVDLPSFVPEEDVGYLPREATVLLCTGSQGEPTSALARISGGAHPHVTLSADDTVIFSSRVIPGNEVAIGRVQNRLVRQQIRVITDADAPVHVSGHPPRDELALMYECLRPATVVPMHGESRHLRAQARLAAADPRRHVVVAENGDMVRLAPGRPEIVDQVTTGVLCVDGDHLVPGDSEAIRHRRRVGFHGHALVTLILDRRGGLQQDPLVTLPGVNGSDGASLVSMMGSEVRFAIESLPKGARSDDEAVREAVRRAVRRTARSEIGKKPVTEVHLIRM